MKINDKKTEQVLIPLPKVASSLSNAKEMKKIVPTASWDNLIYPMSNPDGQDQEDKTFVGGTADFS